MKSIALDAAGHRRSPATVPGYHQGRAPRNKGMHYPADPPTIEEIVAVIRVAGEKPDGLRPIDARGSPGQDPRHRHARRSRTESCRRSTRT
jgi:hypothetical protein